MVVAHGADQGRRQVPAFQQARAGLRVVEAQNFPFGLGVRHVAVPAPAQDLDELFPQVGVQHDFADVVQQAGDKRFFRAADSGRAWPGPGRRRRRPANAARGRRAAWHSRPLRAPASPGSLSPSPDCASSASPGSPRLPRRWRCGGWRRKRPSSPASEHARPGPDRRPARGRYPAALALGSSVSCITRNTAAGRAGRSRTWRTRASRAASEAYGLQLHKPRPPLAVGDRRVRRPRSPASVRPDRPDEPERRRSRRPASPSARNGRRCPRRRGECLPESALP